MTSPVFFRHTLANTAQTRSNWLESHYTYQFQPIWCINLAGIDIFYNFAAKLHSIYVEFYWQKRRNSVATYAFTVSEIRVCGSAAAWILKKLINDRGGLHNRLTERIVLRPFTLLETEAFLRSKGATYDRYQLIELYMTMGGIPFYLENVQINRSVAQNVDRMCFSPGGLLTTEYENLYRSLFERHERHTWTN